MAKNAYFPEKKMVVDDSIAPGLKKYRCVLRNYFIDAFNFGISGDRVENVSWRIQGVSLPYTTSFVIMHSSTNDVDQDQPNDIVVAIKKIAKTKKTS